MWGIPYLIDNNTNGMLVDACDTVDLAKRFASCCGIGSLGKEWAKRVLQDPMHLTGVRLRQIQFRCMLVLLIVELGLTEPFMIPGGVSGRI